MSGKSAIEVKKNGGGLPLPMQALQEQLSSIMQDGPVSCGLKSQSRQRVAGLDGWLNYGVSPDLTKVFFAQINCGSFWGGADRLVIDIWSLKTFKIEKQFSSEKLAVYVSGSNSTDDGNAMN